MPEYNWVDGTVPTASDLNAGVRDQVITTCLSSGRPAGTIGQKIFETDTLLEYTHNGTGWVLTGGVGAWVSYTPALVQSSALTKTVTYAKSWKLGRQVTFTVKLAPTSSGTANNPVTVSLPFMAASSGFLIPGTGMITDASGPSNKSGPVYLLSTTTVAIVDGTQAVNVLLGQTGAVFADALVSGDGVQINGVYEAAA